MLFSLIFPSYLANFIYCKDKGYDYVKTLLVYPLFVLLINMICFICMYFYLDNVYVMFNNEMFNVDFLVKYNLLAISLSLIIPKIVLCIEKNITISLEVKKIENN